jgi:dihydrofolate reductase
MIWAQDSAGGLGLEGKMAWHIPEDFQHFKATTTGKTVVMGSKTWAGLPAQSQPLPNRRNVVLSRVDDTEFSTRFPSAHRLDFAEVVELARTEDVFIIGGASVYEQFMRVADSLIVTELNASWPVDIYAPKIPGDFTLVNEGAWQNTTQKKDQAIVKWRILEYRRI